MKLFIKTQAALVLGSIADFGTTFLLVDVVGCWYVAGNVLGNIDGAVMQFVLSRQWVFSKSRQRVPAQAGRFVLMWAGNIALSAGGVYLLTNFAGLHYLLSKLIVSILLGMSYTYLVSKYFVFV